MRLSSSSSSSFRTSHHHRHQHHHRSYVGGYGGGGGGGGGGGHCCWLKSLTKGLTLLVLLTLMLRPPLEVAGKLEGRRCRASTNSDYQGLTLAEQLHHSVCKPCLATTVTSQSEMNIIVDRSSSSSSSTAATSSTTTTTTTTATSSSGDQPQQQKQQHQKKNNNDDSQQQKQVSSEETSSSSSKIASSSSSTATVVSITPPNNNSNNIHNKHNNESTTTTTSVSSSRTNDSDSSSPKKGSNTSTKVHSKQSDPDTNSNNAAADAALLERQERQANLTALLEHRAHLTDHLDALLERRANLTDHLNALLERKKASEQQPQAPKKERYHVVVLLMGMARLDKALVLMAELIDRDHYVTVVTTQQMSITNHLHDILRQHIPCHKNVMDFLHVEAFNNLNDAWPCQPSLQHQRSSVVIDYKNTAHHSFYHHSSSNSNAPAPVPAAPQQQQKTHTQSEASPAPSFSYFTSSFFGWATTTTTTTTTSPPPTSPPPPTTTTSPTSPGSSGRGGPKNPPKVTKKKNNNNPIDASMPLLCNAHHVSVLMRKLLRIVTRMNRRPDVIVADSTLLAGLLVAEASKLPCLAIVPDDLTPSSNQYNNPASSTLKWTHPSIYRQLVVEATTHSQQQQQQHAQQQHNHPNIYYYNRGEGAYSSTANFAMAWLRSLEQWWREWQDQLSMTTAFMTYNNVRRKFHLPPRYQILDFWKTVVLWTSLTRHLPDPPTGNPRAHNNNNTTGSARGGASASASASSTMEQDAIMVDFKAYLYSKTGIGIGTSASKGNSLPLISLPGASVPPCQPCEYTPEKGDDPNDMQQQQQQQQQEQQEQQQQTVAEEEEVGDDTTVSTTCTTQDGSATSYFCPSEDEEEQAALDDTMEPTPFQILLPYYSHTRSLADRRRFRKLTRAMVLLRDSMLAWPRCPEITTTTRRRSYNNASDNAAAADDDDDDGSMDSVEWDGSVSGGFLSAAASSSTSSWMLGCWSGDVGYLDFEIIHLGNSHEEFVPSILHHDRSSFLDSVAQNYKSIVALILPDCQTSETSQWMQDLGFPSLCLPESSGFDDNVNDEDWNVRLIALKMGRMLRRIILAKEMGEDVSTLTVFVSDRGHRSSSSSSSSRTTTTSSSSTSSSTSRGNPPTKKKEPQRKINGHTMYGTTMGTIADLIEVMASTKRESQRDWVTGDDMAWDIWLRLGLVRRPSSLNNSDNWSTGFKSTLVVVSWALLAAAVFYLIAAKGRININNNNSNATTTIFVSYSPTTTQRRRRHTNNTNNPLDSSGPSVSSSSTGDTPAAAAAGSGAADKVASVFLTFFYWPTFLLVRMDRVRDVWTVIQDEFWERVPDIDRLYDMWKEWAAEETEQMNLLFYGWFDKPEIATAATTSTTTTNMADSSSGNASGSSSGSTATTNNTRTTTPNHTASAAATSVSSSSSSSKQHQQQSSNHHQTISSSTNHSSHGNSVNNSSSHVPQQSRKRKTKRK